jgi:phospholipase/carboxylesterase
MRPIRAALGGLSCVVLDGAPEPGRPELAVVLCHGFGAPGEDLVGLGAEVVRQNPEIAARTRFVFPAAPLCLSGLGFGDSRAWWLIDVERIMSQRMQPEGMKRLREEIPEGMAKSRRLLLALLDELVRQTGLPYGRVVLGGFSQGAMLATDVALRLEEAPAALCALSGTLICESEWSKRAPLRKGLSVLQSHGRQDPLLPYTHAEALRDLLVDAGLSVDFLSFEGQHTIPLEAVARMGALLSALLQKR